MLQTEIQKNVRFNFTVNIADGAFFGLAALGLASTVTIIPLFLNTLGASEILIGLIGSMYTVGWQLPQLFTAGYVARLPRFKPTVVSLTFHERWPFFGLAAVALFMYTLNANVAIALTFLLVAIYALGGGVTATAWQSMIGKIMPLKQRGAFFGTQSAMANLLGAGGAILAGVLLEKLPSPLDYTLCFFLAGVAMMISLWFLSRTREPAHEVPAVSHTYRLGWKKMGDILRRDGNFRWFLVARALSSVAWVAVLFYTIYAVRSFNMSETTAGIMTSIMTLSQTVANPILGWMGDRWGHRRMFGIGAVMIAISAGCALLATDIGWFYLAFGLAGLANASFWAIVITLTLEFGEDHEKPLYIGLANTLIAPVSLIAPVIGGVLAQSFGFQSTFLLSMTAGLLTATVLHFAVKDPRTLRAKLQPQAVSVEDRANAA